MTDRTMLSARGASRDDVGHLYTRMALAGPPGRMLDPFLLLAHHGPQHFPEGNDGLPFGPHPHRGFETVTFIVEGELLHKDSAGHDSVIRDGGVQWMTAGAGVVHSETSPQSFLDAGGPLEILQLWLNLPARLKMTAPRYIGLDGSDVARVPLAGGAGTLHLISGELDGVAGPVHSLTDAFVSTAALRKGAEATLSAPLGRTVLFYVIRGEVAVGETTLAPATLATFAEDGDAIRVKATEEALVLFAHAPPIGEPVVVRGPFVMNTDAEISQALADLRAGRLSAREEALIS